MKLDKYTVEEICERLHYEIWNEYQHNRLTTMEVYDKYNSMLTNVKLIAMQKIEDSESESDKPLDYYTLNEVTRAYEEALNSQIEEYEPIDTRSYVTLKRYRTAMANIFNHLITRIEKGKDDSDEECNDSQSNPPENNERATDLFNRWVALYNKVDPNILAGIRKLLFEAPENVSDYTVEYNKLDSKLSSIPTMMTSIKNIYTNPGSDGFPLLYRSNSSSEKDDESKLVYGTIRPTKAMNHFEPLCCTNKEIDDILGEGERNMRNLTEKEIEAIETNPDNINWFTIFGCYKLPLDFIEKYHDRTEWHQILCKQTVSEEFIRKYVIPCISQMVHEGRKELIFRDISRYQPVSENFIREYKEKVSWYDIGTHQVLSEDFIEEFYDRLNMRNIERCQMLNEDFIDRHFIDMDLNLLVRYQKLSERFIDLHRDDIDWMAVLDYQNVSTDFIKAHYPDFITVDDLLYSDKPIPDDNFIRKHIKELINTNDICSNVNKLISKQILPIDIMRDEDIKAIINDDDDIVENVNLTFNYAVNLTEQQKKDLIKRIEDSMEDKPKKKKK